MNFPRFFLAAFLFFAGTGMVQVRADNEPANALQAEITASSPEMEKLDIPAEELKAVYAARGGHLIWNFSAGENGQNGTAFVDSLEEMLTYHGLRTEDYPIDLIKNLKNAADEHDRDRLDVLVTASLLRLAHDLHGDTISLSDDYPGWVLERPALDMPALLAAALANGTANRFITDLAPQNAAYVNLALALRSYRAYAAKGAWPKITLGPSLRPHDQGVRVQQLRARLAAEDYLDASAATGDVFDDNVEKALIAYQAHNGLDTDGHAGTQTQQALNRPVDARIEQIRANMERWRHMPDDFPPDRYAVVNIAAAALHIFEDSKEVYSGPVVIGKVDRKTPFIASQIRSMIVNPSWHVPTKIAKKDILPKLKKDPHYLEKLGFVISGNQNDPYGQNIDWNQMPEREFNFRLRQTPGDQNSLGHLKFDFDNDFAVYMHGTPHQELFAKAQRNFSSGCIRLRDPDKVGEFFLKGTHGDWTAEKIDAEVAKGKTHWVGIANPMPLYVLYWTVFNAEDGSLQFRKDVYDYDRVMEDTAVLH